MPNNTSNTKEEGFETIIVKYLIEIIIMKKV